MIETIQNYLNYELPEIIKYNIGLFLHYVDTTVGIAPLILGIIFIFYIFYSLKVKKIQEASFDSQNMFFEDLGGIEDVEEAEEYILSYNEEIGANYTAFYEKRGKTFMLLSDNTKDSGNKLAVPLKVNEAVRRRGKKVAGYKVYNYISEDKQFLLTFYSLKTIHISKYLGFLEMILQYYETLRKGFDTNVEQQIQEHSKIISEEINEGFLGHNSFLKFMLSLVLKISKAQGLRIFSDKKDIHLGEISEKNNMQKLFYIRNTPYKMEVYAKESLTAEQLGSIGNFLELSGTFLLTLADDTEVVEKYIKFLKEATVQIETLNPNYFNHSKKVAVVAVHTAKALFLGQDNIKNIKVAALIHDIGMSGDIETLINSSNKLEENDFDAIKYHPIIGSIIIHPISNVYPIGSTIKYHHERFDGKGYPYGLKGNNIPLEAQILSFSESFIGIMGNRSYKKGLSFDDAIKEIQQMSGKAFNPVVINAFLESIDTIKKRLEKLNNKEQ